MKLTEKQKKFLRLLEEINDRKHGTEQASFSIEGNNYFDGPLSIILEAVEKLN